MESGTSISSLGLLLSEQQESLSCPMVYRKRISWAYGYIHRQSGGCLVYEEDLLESSLGEMTQASISSVGQTNARELRPGRCHTKGCRHHHHHLSERGARAYENDVLFLNGRARCTRFLNEDR
jgi:hypothetical protein